MIRILRNNFKKLLKKYWIYKVQKKCGSYKGRIYIGGKSYIGSNVHLGLNVSFNGIKIHNGGRVIIGDNFHSGVGCLLIPQNHNYEGNQIPYDATYIKKEIVIEDNVWLGDRVIILSGVTIGEGAIIQAGAVVVKDIEACGIAGGNPARIFKYRNKEHYYKLKEQKQFH